MRVRVVTYAPDARTRMVARRITDRFSAEWGEVRCPRYSSVLGPLWEWQDRSRGTLPEIEVDPPIGSVDALIVGAPLSGGHLARPMRAFLSRPNRIPPVLGVVATCARRYPAPGFEEDVAPLANSFDGPETVILSQLDMDTAKESVPRSLTAFFDRLAPTVEIQLTPAILPFQVA